MEPSSTPGSPTRWRCAACGAVFIDDDAPSPRCPKCLKQSRVTRAPAEPVVVTAPAAPSLQPRAPGAADAGVAEDDGRMPGVALGFALVPALCAALLSSGWFVELELHPLAGVALALVGTPIAGWLAGRDVVERIFASLAAVVAAVGIVMATAYYVRGHRAPGNVELLLPMLLGGLPGLGIHRLFGVLAVRPLARVVAAVAALVSTVVAVAAF